MRLIRLRRLEPLVRPFVHFYWRWSRGATLGARALVIDGSGRIFLVKHSYIDGWHLPGGGVETGETVLTALARELAEEGNIQLTATPVLHGVTTWRCSSCATSTRTRRRSPTSRSSTTASLRSTRCRRTSPAPPAPASPKCSALPRSANCGERAPVPV
jgi:8-oxo-dGTP pyrophosphatase MutT (NUDIX family)